MYAVSKNELCLIGKQRKATLWAIKGTSDGGKTWREIGNLENDLQSLSS